MKLIAVLFLGILLAACAEEKRVDPLPAFKVGQMVTAKISGQSGMVTSIRCEYREVCGYYVRFASVEVRTNVRLLGRDGAVTISPLAQVYLREFELTEARP